MKHERRPYHRTADSVWREPWDNNVLAFMGRISAYLHERWRTERIEDPDEACRAIVPHGVLCSLAGTHEMRTARARCAALTAHIGLTITAYDAHRMQIYWPNWSNVQGLYEIAVRKSPAEPRQSASSVQRPSSSEESDAPTGARREPVKSVRKKEPEPITEEARALTRGFLDSRAAPFPASKPPTPSAYAKWELEMDRLLRIDSRTPDQVIVLTRWLFDPTSRASPDAVFWRANIQSVPKLREKWDQLEACRLRGKSNGKQTVTDAAENVVRRFSAFAAERGR